MCQTCCRARAVNRSARLPQHQAQKKQHRGCPSKQLWPWRLLICSGYGSCSGGRYRGLGGCGDLESGHATLSETSTSIDRRRGCCGHLEICCGGVGVAHARVSARETNCLAEGRRWGRRRSCWRRFVGEGCKELEQLSIQSQGVVVQAVAPRAHLGLGHPEADSIAGMAADMVVGSPRHQHYSCLRSQHAACSQG